MCTADSTNNNVLFLLLDESTFLSVYTKNTHQYYYSYPVDRRKTHKYHLHATREANFNIFNTYCFVFDMQYTVKNTDSPLWIHSLTLWCAFTLIWDHKEHAVFNNFKPARFGFVSARRALLSVRHTVKTHIRFSHNHSSCLPAPLPLLNIMHQHSLVALNGVVAHTNPLTYTHMERQIKSMATFLHIRKRYTVGGQQRSPPTHRVFNCKHVQIHLLYLTLAHIGSAAFIHVPLGKCRLCMHTYT